MPKKYHQGLAILVILAVGAFFLTGGKLPFSIACGSTTLSLSQATFDNASASFFAGQKVWIINAVAGGLCQSYTGTISKDEIAAKSGQKPENDLYLNVVSTNQSCEWPVAKELGATPVSIFTIREHLDQNVSCQGTLQAQCTDTQYGTPFYSGRYASDPLGTSSSCFCVYEKIKTSAIDPFLSNPGDVHTISQITVGTGTKTETGTFDSKTDTQKLISDNVGYAWNGNLIRNFCVLPTDVMAFYSTDAGEWQLNEKVEYDTYKIDKQNLLSGLRAACGTTADLWGGTCVYNDVHGLADSINSGAGNIINLPLDVPRNSAQMEGAIYVRDQPSNIAPPNFVFYVKADWIGIHQPSPDISMTGQCIAPEFRDNGIVSVTLQNTGDNGNAEASLSCPSGSGFNVVGNAQQVNMPSGSQRVVQFNVNANIATPRTQDCTVRVNDFFHDRTATCTLTARPSEVCTLNDKRCNLLQNRVEICDTNKQWQIFETCDGTKGFQCDLTKLSCVSNGNQTNQTICLKDGEIKGVVQNTLGQKCCEGLVETKGTDVLGLEKICRKPDIMRDLFDAYLWIAVLAVLGGLTAWAATKNTTYVALFALVGAVIGYLIQSILALPAIVQLLGGGIIIYVFGGAIASIMLAIMFSYARGKLG